MAHKDDFEASTDISSASLLDKLFRERRDPSPQERWADAFKAQPFPVDPVTGAHIGTCCDD